MAGVPTPVTGKRHIIALGHKAQISELKLIAVTGQPAAAAARPT